MPGSSITQSRVMDSLKEKRLCSGKKRTKTTNNKSLKTAASGRGRQYFCLVTAYVLHRDGREILAQRIRKLRHDTVLPLQHLSQVLKTSEMFRLKQCGVKWVSSVFPSLPYLQTLPKVLCVLLLNKKIFKSITQAQGR